MKGAGVGRRINGVCVEYLTGILVTFPKGAQLTGAHRDLADKYLTWIKHEPCKLKNIYTIYRERRSCGFSQFVFLLTQFCSKRVLDELDSILALTNPSNGYRHLQLDNDIVVVYAVGRIAYLLSLAIAFGFGPLLQIKDSYEC